MVPIVSDKFMPSSQPEPLQPDEIHLWFFPQWPLSRDSAGSKFVRRWLAGYRGCDADAVVIERDVRGKPFLPNQNLHFNLSHSGNALLLGVTESTPVGVDLEALARPRRVAELARRWFDPAEAEALSRLPESDRLNAFTRLWSCKEALLKADGCGIADGLHRAVFQLDAAGGVAAPAAANGFPGYSVVPVEPAVGFVGALATAARRASIKAFRFSGRVEA